MRTTLDIDDSVLAAAKAMAHDESISVGSVVSRLARTGLEHRSAVGNRGGFPVFAASASARPITIAQVNDNRDD